MELKLATLGREFEPCGGVCVCPCVGHACPFVPGIILICAPGILCPGACVCQGCPGACVCHGCALPPGLLNCPGACVCHGCPLDAGCGGGGGPCGIIGMLNEDGPLNGGIIGMLNGDHCPCAAYDA